MYISFFAYRTYVYSFVCEVFRQIFELTICLVGFNSLRSCISSPIIKTDCVLVINNSNISLLERNIQNMLFEILVAINIFLSCSIFPTGITWSFCSMLLIKFGFLLLTIDWSKYSIQNIIVSIRNSKKPIFYIKYFILCQKFT